MARAGGGGAPPPGRGGSPHPVFEPHPPARPPPAPREPSRPARGLRAPGTTARRPAGERRGVNRATPPANRKGLVDVSVAAQLKPIPFVSPSFLGGQHDDWDIALLAEDA